MSNRFVIFGSKLGFDNATEDQYDENSFVIIEETEEIWVHGKIHKLVNFNIDDYLTKEDFENYKEEIEQFKGSITDIIGSGLKTINGESIVGEGNIEIKGGSDVKVKEDDFHNLYFQDLEGNTIAGSYPEPQYSVVFGEGNKLSGEFSNSKGSYNLIAGKNNSVGADYNIVNGDSNSIGYSGFYNIVNGINNNLLYEQGKPLRVVPNLSVVNGYNNTVRGSGSVVVGRNLNTYNEYELAFGDSNNSHSPEDDVQRYVEQYPNYTIFSIGHNGEQKDTLANKFEIRQHGDIHIADIHDPEYTNFHLVKTFCLQDKLKEIEESIGNSQDLPLEKGTNDNSVQLKGCSASGSGAVAMGAGCRATGEGAIALGRNSVANGLGAVCLGQGSANGSFSITMGLNNNVGAERSVAMCDETRTFNSGEVACGRCNLPVNGSGVWGSFENTLFTIGNGVWGQNPAHNAFEVRQDGTILIPDVSAEGNYYEKPMLKLQDCLFISKVLTQDEYDNLDTKDENTFYFIKEEGE